MRRLEVPQVFDEVPPRYLMRHLEAPQVFDEVLQAFDAFDADREPFRAYHKGSCEIRTQLPFFE